MHFWLLIALIALPVTHAGATRTDDTRAQTQNSRPNILLIVLDDFGYNDLGANGNPDTPTPNLNQLAAQGMRYTRHYAHSTCSIARTALMTGHFPSAHGIRPNHLGLSKGTPTIASALQHAGYHTEHIGKWHIATATLEQSPGQLGFDNWFGFLHNHELGGPAKKNMKYHKPRYENPWLRDNNSRLKQYQGHLTDLLTQRAINFINSEKTQGQPWFLNLWYYAPHTPVRAAAIYRERYPDTKEGNYHALIEQLDTNIGLLMDTLERSGEFMNTLVIVLSDNGGTNSSTDNNYPYYGKKNQFYEGSFRTPLLMRWPGHIAAHGVTDEIVSLYDIFPTIGAASGAELPPGLVGRNLLDDARPATPQIYWEYSDSNQFSYSILSPDGRWRYSAGTWIHPVLNDLKNNPNGDKNVLAEHPRIAENLHAKYLKLRKADRNVDFTYEPLNTRGGAVLRGDDLQRSPGYSGFTFAIAVTPAAKPATQPQFIAEQADRWSLRLDTRNALQLDILGQKVEFPDFPTDHCSDVVVSSHFAFTPFYSQDNWGVISLFVDGKFAGSKTVEKPRLQTWGYNNPTYIGFNSQGQAPFLGKLKRPVIWNERLVNDKDGALIGNGISEMPSRCPAE